MKIFVWFWTACKMYKKKKWTLTASTQSWSKSFINHLYSHLNLLDGVYFFSKKSEEYLDFWKTAHSFSCRHGENTRVRICFDFYYIELPQRLNCRKSTFFNFFLLWSGNRTRVFSPCPLLLRDLGYSELLRNCRSVESFQPQNIPL